MTEQVDQVSETTPKPFVSYTTDPTFTCETTVSHFLLVQGDVQFSTTEVVLRTAKVELVSPPIVCRSQKMTILKIHLWIPILLRGKMSIGFILFLVLFRTIPRGRLAPTPENTFFVAGGCCQDLPLLHSSPVSYQFIKLSMAH